MKYPDRLERDLILFQDVMELFQKQAQGEALPLPCLSGRFAGRSLQGEHGFQRRQIRRKFKAKKLVVLSARDMPLP
jgi:hypothetical protein